MNVEQTNAYKNPLILFSKKTATFQSKAHYMYTIDTGTAMLYCLFLDGPLQINRYLYLDITNILVVFPQICYTEVLDTLLHEILATH